MPYLKTDIQLEKRNSAKKTVSTYITNELRSSNTHCLELMSEANWSNFSEQELQTSTSYKQVFQFGSIYRDPL